MRKILLIIMPLFFLTSCAGMNSKFDCDMGPGGTCQPMDQVNQEASSGVFNTNSVSFNSSASFASSVSANTPEAEGYPLAAYDGQPVRTGETIQRVWIAPFEDQDGNYHEPSYVYTVVKTSKWIGNPVKETADE